MQAEMPMLVSRDKEKPAIYPNNVFRKLYEKRERMEWVRN